MKNYVDGDGIPMGLGIALAQNLKAMNCFSSLSDEDKKDIINGTHRINSKDEMRRYVDSIPGMYNMR